MVFEIIFMLVILKIPIVYLCVVVWWAIKAEPTPGEPTEAVVVEDTPPADGPPLAASQRQAASVPAAHEPVRRAASRPHRGGVHA